MPDVRVMSDTLASQVAAGEVIERPASVIKELVENSLDAGALKIEVESQRGGVAMLKVRDDGSGMSEENALKSLERHATSKLQTSEGLNQIKTLGFRGEALPSIASVSRFLMQTCEAGAVGGTEIRIEGGDHRSTRAVGCPVGTMIEVRDLFYKVPARRKFLKAETTEAAHIDHQVRLHALSAPGVGWVLRKDGRVTLDLPATTDRRVRIEAMTGGESGKALIEIPNSSHQSVSVSGAILPAEFARRGRRHQYVFLNGRPVEDSIIAQALREGFRGALAEGLQPAAWIWLEVDPSLVDVNVHPAKREVRFAKPAMIRQAIAEALDRAMRPPVRETPPAKPSDSTVELAVVRGAQTVVRPKTHDRPEREIPSPPPLKPSPTWHHEEQVELDVEPKPETQNPGFRIIGTLSDRYALLEGDEGLVLMEPKAARERIFYERLLLKEKGIESQGLLVPVLLELDARDIDLLMRNQEHFSDAGFSLEAFGGRTVQISATPAFLESGESRQVLTELVDAVLERGSAQRVKRLAYEGFAAKVAQVGAKQERWNEGSLKPLLDDLFQCDLPYCDPAGRPTLVQISFQELNRKFGKS